MILLIKQVKRKWKHKTASIYTSIKNGTYKKMNSYKESVLSLHIFYHTDDNQDLKLCFWVCEIIN